MRLSDGHVSHETLCSFLSAAEIQIVHIMVISNQRKRISMPDNNGIFDSAPTF
jgi:hypothetical protein